MKKNKPKAGSMSQFFLDALNSSKCDQKGDELIECVDHYIDILIDDKSSNELKMSAESLLTELFYVTQTVFSYYPKDEDKFLNAMSLTRKVKNEKLGEFLEDYFDSVEAVFNMYPKTSKDPDTIKRGEYFRKEIASTKDRIGARKDKFDKIVASSKSNKSDDGKDR